MAQATHPSTDPGIEPNPDGDPTGRVPGAAAFPLDPRLEADTRAVAALPSGTLRLVDDARWFWAVIVPHRASASELHHLPDTERAALMDDVARLSEAVEAITACRSVNVGMLGNVVPQLHVHVVARHEGDPAWPGPVWGHGAPEPMADGEARQRAGALRGKLGLDREPHGRAPSEGVTR